MSSLYELTGNRLSLQKTLEENGYDFQTIADTLEGESVEIQTKIEDYGYVIKNRNSFADSIDAEIIRLTERRDAERARVKSIEDNLLRAMIACEFKLIECPAFKITVKNNPPKVEILDEAQIPAAYMRQPEIKVPPKAADKKLIAEAIKSGLEVAGCKLIQSQRLEIK